MNIKIGVWEDINKLRKICNKINLQLLGLGIYLIAKSMLWNTNWFEVVMGIFILIPMILQYISYDKWYRKKNKEKLKLENEQNKKY